MVRKNRWMYAAILLVCGIGIFTSCQGGTPLRKVNGVLEAPVADMAYEKEDAYMAPEIVENAYAHTVKVHTFELMSDTANHISVDGIGELDNGFSTEGYGVMITKNATSTSFHGIRNSRQPRAFYDAATGSLWLTSCVMEGTGTNVEKLYKMQFGTADDSARIVLTVNPYQMQQKLISHLNYSLKEDQLTFYANGLEIASVQTAVKDMGVQGAEQLVWIGEQLSYDLADGHPRVCFVPGVKISAGQVLSYDKMPTLSAAINLKPDGTYTLSDFQVKSE